MDIKIVGDDKAQTSTPPKAPLTHGTVEGFVQRDIEIKSMADVMGVEKYEVGLYSDDLDVLLRYAKSQTEDHSIESLKNQIRKIGNKLGSPPFPENRVKYVKNYAAILLQEIKLREDKKRFNQKHI